jgi:alpha-L-fucosidase
MDKVREYLKRIDEVIAEGPFTDAWPSLRNHPLPKWYREAKFGIFIHWGAYSVPAFSNEWYPRNMYQRGTPEYEHHVATYGPHSSFGYKDFIPLFKAENYDPAAWAELFAEAGARFVMPVAEHHDGFQMYDSDLSEWCAAKMGPRRDLMGELFKELSARGIVTTLSSHRVEHYWFLEGGREFPSDFPDPIPYGHLYWPSAKLPQEDRESICVDSPIDPDFLDDWLARCCELVDQYHPRLVYFDWWIQVEPMKPYLKRFAAYYYNRAAERGEEVAIDYKYDAFAYGSAVQDIERGQYSTVSPNFWQNDTTVGKKSWGYIKDNEYKEPESILADLVDVVAKNGSLLLNIGPKPDGSIPEEDQRILKSIGAWLKVNGEGIYSTMYWKRSGEGPTTTPEGAFTDEKRLPYTSEDFRFTYKDGCVYAFALKWPDEGKVLLKTFAKDSRSCTASLGRISILGYEGPVLSRQEREGLSIQASLGARKEPVCIKIQIED